MRSPVEEPLDAEFEFVRVAPPKAGDRAPMIRLALGVAALVFIGAFCAICVGTVLGVALLSMG